MIDEVTELVINSETTCIVCHFSIEDFNPDDMSKFIEEVAKMYPEKSVLAIPTGVDLTTWSLKDLKQYVDNINKIIDAKQLHQSLIGSNSRARTAAS